MEKDEAEFTDDLFAARRYFESGLLPYAVDRVVYLRGRSCKEPELFKLLREIYATVESPLTEVSCRRNPWQLNLLFELYSLWPKVHLEEALLKHSFPEPPASEFAVSGSEQVQLAWYSTGFLSRELGALSRGKSWLKLWNLETGEVIHARNESLRLLASAIGRDGAHLLFSTAWHSEAAELHWSTSFKETFRRIPTGRGGPYLAPPNSEIRYYKVKGEVESVKSGREIEVEREEFERNPIVGEVLRPREFKPRTPRLIEYINETRSPEEAEEYFREDDLARQREKQIVRLKLPQTITLTHEAIGGYLPAGTTTFVAEDGWGDLGPKVSDLRGRSGPLTATVAVAGNEAWLENVIVPGHGLRGMYGLSPTMPITAVCISSDGSLGLRNGNGETFGIWNLWTGDCLREFVGHTGRVTCLCLSVDVSFAVSGSEDKTVRVWTPVSAECVRVMAGHESAITAVCISLDATKILSADYDGVIKLWDRATGDCLRTIQAHSQKISGLHLTVDGKFAASSSWDKTVKLWNLTDGSCMKTLEHSDWVTSVDMTPDGRYLVSSSYEGTKVWELVWRLEPRDVVEWDEGARPYLEILLNANAAWDGKLSTPVDMSAEEKKNTLRRQGPTWTAWHAPSKKEDWYRVWHLNWDINETLGHAGYGWLSEAGREGTKIMDEWKKANPG